MAKQGFNAFGLSKKVKGRQATPPKLTPMPYAMKLPMPPSANAAYSYIIAMSSKGKRYAKPRLSDKGDEYRTAISIIIARKGIYFGRQDLKLTVDIYWKDRRSCGDVDNRMKQLQDALQVEPNSALGAVWNDSQFKAVSAKHIGLDENKRGFIWVEFSKFEEGQRINYEGEKECG